MDDLMYLLWCTFADPVPIAFKVDVSYGGTLVDWVKGQEVNLSYTFSGLLNKVPIHIKCLTFYNRTLI